MTVRMIRVAALGAALCAAHHVNAEPRPLDVVVVTGTKISGDFGEKSGVPLAKLPQSVQIVTAEEIRDRGAISIGDLLRNVPSADPGYSRVGPWQSFSLKIRGFYADQMRNGMRQRYYEDVDASALSNIERVEVLKGPSGVLYGQSAVGGIVSIITKRPEEDFGASLSASLGSYEQKVISGDITGELASGLSARFTGELERSDTFVDHQFMDRDNAAFSLRYAPSDKVSAHLVTEYVERRTKRHAGLPLLGTIESNGVGPVSREEDLGEPSITDLDSHAPLVQLWVDFRLSEHWSLTPRLQYQQFNTTFGEIRVRAPVAGSTTQFTRTGRVGREDDEYSIAQLDLRGEFDTGGIGHQVLMGYEMGYERARFTQSNLVGVPGIDALDPQYAYGSTEPTTVFAYDNFYNLDGDALYLQDLVSLTDRWDAVVALRHSWIDAWDGTWNGATVNQAEVTPTLWQLGTTYRLTDAWSVYAGFNSGFDIESTSGARTRTGEPIDPEESRQVEAGLRFSGGNFRGSAALFQIERVNALTTDPIDPDYYVNAGEQRVRGFEVEGAWLPTEALEFTAGYAHLDGEITESNDGDVGGRIGDMPKHTVTARVAWQVPGMGLSLRGGVSYVSERALVNASDVTIPSYTLADFGVGYDFGSVRLDALLYNLFDERYFSASGNAFTVIPGDPRSVSLRASMRW